MKTLLIICFIPGIAFSQFLEPDSITGIYTQKEVITVDSLKKETMYSMALQWIALNYKSSTDVVKLSDPTAGKIVIKANFPTSLFMKDGWIRHTLVLEFKDGKFRYTFSNYSYYSPGSGEIAFEDPMAMKKRVVEDAQTSGLRAMISLEDYLKTAKETTDDW